MVKKKWPVEPDVVLGPDQKASAGVPEQRVKAIWKLGRRPDDIGFIAYVLEDDTVGVLVSKSQAQALFARPPHSYSVPHKAYDYTVLDLPALRQERPDIVEESERKTGAKVSEHTTYWWDKAEVLEGVRPFETGRDVGYWLTHHGWREEKDLGGWWRKKVGRYTVRL